MAHKPKVLTEIQKKKVLKVYWITVLMKKILVSLVYVFKHNTEVLSIYSLVFSC